MEKLSEGGSVFRTEEAEERVRRQYERQKQDKMERLYTQIQSGLEHSEVKSRRKSRKRWTQREVAVAFVTWREGSDRQRRAEYITTRVLKHWKQRRILTPGLAPAFKVTEWRDSPPP